MATPQLERASKITIVVTFVLFVLAVVLKGLSHDLLLEAGVFLVSVKLIIMADKDAVRMERLTTLLEELRGDVQRMERDRTKAD